MKQLEVQNQGDQNVKCTIISGNENLGSQSLFSIQPTIYSKLCTLTLNSALDYEQKKSYKLTIRVETSNDISRRKRQIYGRYKNMVIVKLFLN